MQNNVMIDLETMGTSPQSPIIAIGAVKFNLTDGIVDRFYHVVSLKSCMDEGLIPAADTILWWLDQSEDARQQLLRSAIPIDVALMGFGLWLGDDARVWGNGAAFDNVILSNAYRALGLNQPWEFYNDRCYRTMKNMFPQVAMDRIGTHHNALNDAESQATHLIDIVTSFGGELK